VTSGANSANDSAAVNAAHKEAQVSDRVEPTERLAKDVVEVRIVNEMGQTLPDVDVYLGTLGQGGVRDKVQARTSNDGSVRFAGLKMGETQAYRVSVLHEGATYASTPFRLAGDRGVAVQLVRRSTTTDNGYVLQALGQVLIEFRDDRLHISQQASLANLGRTTYIFPREGLRVALPKGFTAFATQPTMGDQRVSELEKEGLLIQGSLPPGESVLTWAFDLPLKGSSAEINMPVPFRTYMLRVISEAPQGMRLSVPGMPLPQISDDGQQRVWFTQLERRADDPPLNALKIVMHDIPGPGPARFIAVACALVLLGLGLFATLRYSEKKALSQDNATLDAEQERLCQEVVKLDQLKAQGEIGDQYHHERVSALTAQLAELLREKHAAK